jgi:hypothetical protein
MVDTDSASIVVIDEIRIQEQFTQVPNTILTRSDISPGAKLCYAALLMYGRQKGSCFPGQGRLAADIGVSDRSVRTYLGELRDVGLVQITRRGLGKSNVYRLLMWVERPRAENISAPNWKPTSTTERKNLPPEEYVLEEYTEEEDLRNVGQPDDFDYQTLAGYMDDIGREFRDRSDSRTSLSRLHNLFRRSGLELEDFIEAMQAARQATKAQTARVRGTGGRKALVAYWFGCLERMLVVAEQAQER